MRVVTKVETGGQTSTLGCSAGEGGDAKCSSPVKNQGRTKVPIAAGCSAPPASLHVSSNRAHHGHQQHHQQRHHHQPRHHHPHAPSLDRTATSRSPEERLGEKPSVESTHHQLPRTYNGHNAASRVVPKSPDVRLRQKMGWDRNEEAACNHVSLAAHDESSTCMSNERVETATRGLEPTPFLESCQNTTNDGPSRSSSRNSSNCRSTNKNSIFRHPSSVRIGAIAVPGPGIHQHSQDNQQSHIQIEIAPVEVSANDATPVCEAMNVIPIKPEGFAKCIRNRKVQAAIGLVILAVAGAIIGVSVIERLSNKGKCIVEDISRLGNGICDGGKYNTKDCHWDGGDCITINKFPNCMIPLEDSFKLGNGVCDFGPFFSSACGWDAGDCSSCALLVDDPSLLGDGICQGGSYNVVQCNWDNGDCVVDGYPDCHVDDPSLLGDGICQGGSYNVVQCNWDNGDCVVDGYPDCHVNDPALIGDGICQGGMYSSRLCGYDGGDCWILEQKINDNADFIEMFFTETDGTYTPVFMFRGFATNVAMSYDGSRVVVGGRFGDIFHVFERYIKINSTNKADWNLLGDVIPRIHYHELDNYKEMEEPQADVAISGDGTVVAAGYPYYRTDEDGDGRFEKLGAVVVYKLSEDNTTWAPLGEPFYGEGPRDYLGQGLALNEDGTIVAFGEFRNSFRTGRVTVHKFDGTEWNMIGDIPGENRGEEFGGEVSLSRDGTIVAGSAMLAGDGAARVYKYDGGTEWTQMGSTLYPWEGYTVFGWPVSLSGDGDRLAVSSASYDSDGDIEGGLDTGTVWIFEYDGRLEDWQILGSPINGTMGGDGLGWGLSLSGDGSTFAAGAPNADTYAPEGGLAQVYRYDCNQWVRIGKDIEGSTGDAWTGLTLSLSYDGTFLAVGSPYDYAGEIGNNGYVEIY